MTRRTVGRIVLVVVSVALTNVALAPRKCHAFGRKKYYTKTTSKTITFGHPPAAAAPVAASAPVYYTPMAPVYAPVLNGTVQCCATRGATHAFIFCGSWGPGR